MVGITNVEMGGKCGIDIADDELDAVRIVAKAFVQDGNGNDVQLDVLLVLGCLTFKTSPELSALFFQAFIERAQEGKLRNSARETLFAAKMMLEHSDQRFPGSSIDARVAIASLGGDGDRITVFRDYAVPWFRHPWTRCHSLRLVLPPPRTPRKASACAAPRPWPSQALRACCKARRASARDRAACVRGKAPNAPLRRTLTLEM